MVEGLDALPTWLQTIVASTFAVGAAAAAFKGWTKKKIEELSGDDHTRADTVLISGALADGPAIRDLTAAIRDLTMISVRNHDLMDRMCVGQDRIVVSNERIDNTMQRIRDDVQRIQER